MGLREEIKTGILETVGAVDDDAIDYCLAKVNAARSISDLETSLRSVGLESLAAKLFVLAHADSGTAITKQPKALSQSQLKVLQKEIEIFNEDIEKYGWDNLTTREQQEFLDKKKLLESNIPLVPQSWEEQQLGRVAKRKSESSSESDASESQDDEESDYEYDSDQAIEFDEHDSIKPQHLELESVELPVMQHRAELVDLIRNNQVVIIAGETGSGKTTKIPQFLYEEGFGKHAKIVCTQPRRIAAMSVATRVAQEMRCKIGTKVGYTIRFEDRTSSQTKIQYMTDGMLLREFLTDPDMSEYSAVMIDEAHERTLQTDILLALIKDICKVRPELRVVISSATINSEKFANYFNNAPVYIVPGRRFPVDILYAKQPEANYLQAAIMTVFQIHLTQDPGDILVFLPGQEEIESMADNLLETKRRLGGTIKELLICPIYANLPPEQQAKIFEPTPKGARKVVLATNIAETSLTIDGIVYVIDPGFVKEKEFNPRTMMESLVVKECSQASCNQRAGRAGRVCPGKCFRLFTKRAFTDELPVETRPEVLRTNLAGVVLLLMSFGVVNVFEFDLIDKPAPEALVKAMQTLYQLGAVNGKGQLTKLGKQMAEFPTDPMMAKALISAGSLNCAEDVITVVALLDDLGSVFYRPKTKKEEADRAHSVFKQPQGDHFTLLQVWNNWAAANFSSTWCRQHFVQYRTLKRARDIRNQLWRLCQRAGIPVTSDSDDPDAIQKAMLSGYFINTARLSKSGDFYLAHGTKQSVWIHPSSALHSVEPRPKYVLYHELTLTSREYMRGVMEVEADWIRQVAPHFFKEVEERKQPKPR